MSPRRDNLPQFDDKQPSVISPKSLAISLRYAWGITTIAVFLTVWFMTQMYGLTAQIETLSRKIDGLSRDRWTKSEARESLYNLRDKNPDLKLLLPDVDDISRRIDSEGK